MTQPQYKLRDDHVATAKHLRDERTRNDATYLTQTTFDNYVPDSIGHPNGTSYLIAQSGQILNGLTPLAMNNQKIVNCGAGTLANDVVTKTQLDTKADQATTYTKTESDARFLNLAGGTITGPIYQNTAASELNQLATKQYVLDNAGSGGGGGGHPDKIESTDVAKSTSVVCTTDGVFFSDDSTTIAHISKDGTAAKLVSELDGLKIGTNNLVVTNKLGTNTIADFSTSAVQITAPVRYASLTTTATLPNDIPPLSQVNDLITTAKGQVSQLIDANGDSTTDNNYKLKIDNNQLEFSRGATSNDTWAKLFGSTVESSDAVVLQSNRSNFYNETEDASQADVNYYLTHKQDATVGSTYQASAPLRLSAGTSASF